MTEIFVTQMRIAVESCGQFVIKVDRRIAIVTGWKGSKGERLCGLARKSATVAETAALLASLQEMVDRHSRDSFVTNDIVHWDFNGGNILADETRITGVVDWDGACAGDRGFDLATLMFYSYEVRHIREPVWREALGCSGVGALSIYIAHMIVRQVDWSIRYHPPETINRYLEISGQLLRDLAAA